MRDSKAACVLANSHGEFVSLLGEAYSNLVPARWHVVGTTVWPSGLRRWLQAPVRKGVGSNPTAVIFSRNADAWFCFKNLNTCTRVKLNMSSQFRP